MQLEKTPLQSSAGTWCNCLGRRNHERSQDIVAEANKLPLFQIMGYLLIKKWSPQVQKNTSQINSFKRWWGTVLSQVIHADRTVETQSFPAWHARKAQHREYPSFSSPSSLYSFQFQEPSAGSMHLTAPVAGRPKPSRGAAPAPVPSPAPSPVLWRTRALKTGVYKSKSLSFSHDVLALP